MASSKAASISSNIQNGEGFIFNIEKSKNSKIGKEQELLEITQKRKDENGKMSVNENRINDFRETILHCKNETVRLEIKLEKLEEENQKNPFLLSLLSDSLIKFYRHYF